MNDKTLIQIQNLSVNFPIKKGVFSKPIHLKAVDNISFNITIHTELIMMVSLKTKGTTKSKRNCQEVIRHKKSPIV